MSNQELKGELCCSEDEEEHSKILETTVPKLNLLEANLRQFLSIQDIKILMEITKMNNGDVDNIFNIMQNRIKEQSRMSQFKKFREEVSRSIKLEINDKAKSSRLSQQFRKEIIKINECCSKIEFNQSTLLANIKKNISGLLLENTSNFAKYLVKTCDGGLKHAEVDEQIQSVIELTLPGKIKNKDDIVKAILEKKNFSQIYQIEHANKAEQKKIVAHLECLKYLQIHLKYGKQFVTDKNEFIKLIAEQITKVSNDWLVIEQIIEKIVEDPLYDFSQSQYPTKVLQQIYIKIYTMKQFDNYVQLIQNGQSFKSKQEKDIQKILNQISDRLRPSQEAELKKCLLDYDYTSLYKNDNVGVHKMLRIHKFIQENCKDFLKYEKIRKNNYDEKRPKLIIQLRTFLANIKVPYILHSQIENKVFQNKKYELLDSGLSKEQKKKLSCWMKQKMNKYYQQAFYNLSLQDETRQKLIDIIIRLDLHINYNHIQQTIGEFLKTISPNKLFQSKYLNKQQKQKIQEAVKDHAVVKKYVESAGLDVNKLEFQATQIIFYEIVIPNQIGCLHHQTTEKFIELYLKNPEQETVRKADILNSHKQIFLEKVQQFQVLKKYRKYSQKMRMNRNRESSRKFLKKITDKIVDPVNIALVWKIYQRWGKIQFEENIIEPEDDAYVAELNSGIDSEMLEALKQIQESDEYHQFKYGYPELAKQNYKKAEEDLVKKIKSELKKSLKLPKAGIDEFVKKLQSQDFCLDQLLKQAKFKRSADLTLKLDQFKEFMSLQQSNQRKQEFVEKIQKQKQLKEFLKRQEFFKYQSADKNKILDLFRKEGKQFIYSLSQILLKNDLELIKNGLFTEFQLIFKNDPRPPSPRKNGKKGNLTVESWRTMIQKKLNCPFADIIKQLRLFEPEVQSQLDTYDKKMQVIGQYETEIKMAFQAEKKALGQKIKKNEQSNITDLQVFMEKQKEGSQVSLLVDFYKLGLNQLKEKYNIKMMAPKFNKIKEELKSYEFENIMRLQEELNKIKKYQSQ